MAPRGASRCSPLIIVAAVEDITTAIRVWLRGVREVRGIGSNIHVLGLTYIYYVRYGQYVSIQTRALYVFYPDQRPARVAVVKPRFAVT